MFKCKHLKMEPSSPPTLNMNDIETMVNIISVATKRGTFVATELSRVGSLYDSLTLLIKHLKTTAADNSASDTAASDTAASDNSASDNSGPDTVAPDASSETMG